MSLFPTRARPWLVVAVALLACGGDTAVEAEVPAGIQTPAIATALPGGATVVVSGHDLQGFWSRLESTRLYQELAAIEDVRQAFAPLEEGSSEFERETGLSLDEPTIMTIFGRKFDLGYYGRLEEDRADLLLVAEIEDPAAARSIIEQVEARVVAEKGASFGDLSHAGVDVRVGTDREGREALFYSLGEDRLVMSTTRVRIEQAIDLAAGDEVAAMTGEGLYTDILRKLDRASLVLFIDQQAVREAAQRAAAADTTGREPLAAATSALDDVDLARAVGVGVYWTDSGIRADSYTLFTEGARPGLAGVLIGSPAPVRSLGFQPVGTMLYGAINSIDAAALYAELKRYAIAATRVQMDVEGTPDSARADSVVNSNLAAFEAETGIDIEDDLLSWIGDELSLGVVGVDRTGFFPLPEIGFAIAVRDRGRATAFFGDVETLVGDLARDRASVALAWQEEQYEGRTIRYAPTPLGEGATLAYTVGDDFALVSSSRGVVKRMLDARAGRAQALPSNPDFGTMTAFYPQEVNAIGFLDLEEVLSQVEDLLGTYGEMGGAAADTTSTSRQVLAALKNAPRLGMYGRADGDEGVYGHVLLEVR